MKKVTLWWYDFLATINATKRLKSIFSRCGNYNTADELRLFEAKHAAKIIELYSEKQQMLTGSLLKVFELPNAEKILSNQMSLWRLNDSVEAELLKHPELIELTKTYLKSEYSLSADAQKVLITLPNFEELVEIYLKSDFSSLISEAQLKLFECKESTKLLKLYCCTKGYQLSVEAESKLTEHPDFEEIYESYTYNLRQESIAKLFDRPNASELILQCVTDGSELSKENEAKLFELENTAEIISKYIKENKLFDENEPLLLKLDNAAEVVKNYLTDFAGSATFIDAIFASSEVETYLPLVVATQKLTPEQELKLFEKPNATELLMTYIENNELSEEAQLQLLKMPKKDADPIMRKHANKHSFSHIFLQSLAVNAYAHLLQWCY